MKHFRVIENVYRRHLTVLVTPDEKAAMRAIQKTGAFNKEELPEVEKHFSGTAGFTLFPRRGGDLIMWFKSPKDLGAVAHESVHAAVWILERCGVCLDSDHDEPLAYLVQFFTNSILDALGYGRFTSR